MHITIFSDLIENKRAKTIHGKWIEHAHNWGLESDTQLALRPQGPGTITHRWRMPRALLFVHTISHAII